MKCFAVSKEAATVLDTFFYVDDNLFDDKLLTTSQMFGVFRIDRKFRTCK